MPLGRLFGGFGISQAVGRLVQRKREQEEGKPYSMLFSQRIVVLNGKINTKAADVLITQILELEAKDKYQDIIFCLNSPGGEVKAGLAIYDVMQFTVCDVATVCYAKASSMAVLLLAAGTPGKRWAVPDAKLMIHPPWGGNWVHGANKESQINDMISLQRLLKNILYKHSAGAVESFQQELSRDFLMTAEHAKAHGLIDHMVSLSASPLLSFLRSNSYQIRNSY